MAATRRVVYPEYEAVVVGGGDVMLKFHVAGSKFGPVEVVLVAADAETLADLIEDAVRVSDAYLAAPDGSLSSAPGGSDG